MNKKISLYPMTREQCAMVRYAALLQGFEISKMFVPRFWCMDGMDVSELDGGDEVGRVVINYEKELLSQVDILFVDYEEKLSDLELYRDVISNASEMGIEVICSRNLKQKLNLNKSTEQTSDESPENILYEINCPVITVLTQGNNTDQFAVELALYDYFLNEGYKVVHISSHGLTVFFGSYEIPAILYETTSIYNNILSFNKYVKNIVQKEQAELLILGVPESIMKYNDKLLQGLGILPFTLCSAVKSDVAILCMYYSEYTDKYLDELNRYCNYRLSAPISHLNIGNSGLKLQDVSGDKKLEYFSLNSMFVLQGIKSMKISNSKLFNVLNKDSAYQLCESIHMTLSDNVRYMK